MQIDQYTVGLTSFEAAAAHEGQLYDSETEAVAHARQLNKYRQTQVARAAISQSSNGYWVVHAPGALLISDLLSTEPTARIIY